MWLHVAPTHRSSQLKFKLKFEEMKVNMLMFLSEIFRIWCGLGYVMCVVRQAGDYIMACWILSTNSITCQYSSSVCTHAFQIGFAIFIFCVLAKLKDKGKQLVLKICSPCSFVTLLDGLGLGKIMLKLEMVIRSIFKGSKLCEMFG